MPPWRYVVDTRMRSWAETHHLTSDGLAADVAGDLRPEEMLDLLASSGLTSYHATTSGAPFLEISGPGVTKASGVARLAGHLGIEPHEVLAIGDARNDVELLEWSGIGVAMGNAVAEAVAAADHTTASNSEDGFAQAIERLLTHS